MKTILLINATQYVNTEVSVAGWVASLRSSGKIVFIQLRDGTGYAQAVIVKGQVSDADFSLAKALTQESSVQITGTLKTEPRSPSGFEIAVSAISLISGSIDYPIGNKDHGPSFLLDNRHLWLRSPKQRAIQIIRNEIINAIFEYYRLNNFVKIDTPILTPNACEGTTTLFEVDYFGQPSYLSQSGQLYLEAAIFAVGRGFDFAPVFRAEKSKTRRHLIEFWMTDAEAAFVKHAENLQIQEGLVTHVITRILANCQDHFKTLERDTSQLASIKAPFQRLSYKDAMKMVKDMGSATQMGSDLGAEDETLLMNHFKAPVFVEYFPAAVKAFYMKRHPDDNSQALCADLLAPEGYGEIIGGSQREDDYDTLLASIKAHHLPVDEFNWYLDLRRFGSVPHSGFGLGLERLVAWVCGLKHVREAIPFPRLINRMKP
ncbi:asparagine--tRNA ligase [Microgenomates group bacterium RIFCSPLOWO2_01_FULL_47_10]|nr:MAG: asparagine--tRNA ligase [Microgenomates group bacterium RIFCSPLOWO2_01_FULL_47_10]